MTITYRIHELTDYINWIYFFHAWGFQPRFAEIFIFVPTHQKNHQL